jgi:hypothetical protein
MDTLDATGFKENGPLRFVAENGSDAVYVALQHLSLNMSVGRNSREDFILRD